MDERHVFQNEKELLAALAADIVSDVQSVLAHQSRYTLVLSGGKTPEALYSLLAKPPFKNQIPWEKIHLFMGDERFVPPDHADSNYRMVRHALLENVPLPPSHMHVVPTQAENIKIAAMEYERELRFFFGGVDCPRFDLVLLGIGEDGHTASLFPGTRALEQTRYWVAISESPQAPRERLTLTFPVLNNARRVVFLATGARKFAILKEIFDSPGNKYPAQRIKPIHGKLEWWTDVAAYQHQNA